MKSLIKFNYISGSRPHKLTNVAILSPCIIWVRAGYKRLLSDQDIDNVDTQNLLFIRSGERLTFENQPSDIPFRSCQISFHHSPDQSLLALSIDNDIQHSRIVPLSHNLLSMLEIIKNMSEIELSETVQRCWLDGFYHYLAEHGLLHKLFSYTYLSLTEKLSEHFAQSPADDFSIEKDSQQLGMSRSTLIRHLRQENTSYREVLLNVRMNHAIGLLQAGNRDTNVIALECGYLSEQRFLQRFRERFGLSAKEYMATI
ncbi:helix-turn-helix transcriptional regulator [Vibrio sp.]|uniref:AraC family transcriptional regulator n=1 Tax=Vibrio viridaestus TaxID=2487322 RepID=A0A3N9TIP8_9VIBR|nr:AraC family transcriptional regulator [Vibrio viridaestus]MDC0611067.1 helix-turn-helix transcriptional regulator [Vibrio sp.]RQW64081.1 AraC family transcriptional regulator [Vibrio viridaestus]